MPIRASERARYPADWRAITAEVRVRAGDQCECWGECGHERHSISYRCPEMNGNSAMRFRGKVVLTVAHLDHQPENCGTPGQRKNLKAMCQLCHLSYDRAHHAATRKAANG